MHLKNHIHQLAVYIKRKNMDFPNTLLQQFNFQAKAKSEETTDSKEEQQPVEEDKDKMEK